MSTNQIISSSTYQRLQEYKVDFAYSKNLFYEAVKRIGKEEENYKSTNKIINLASLLLSLFTLSGLALYFADKFKIFSIVAIGLFSLIAFGLNLFQLLNKRSFDTASYKMVADRYLLLYKSVKNTEAKVIDGLINTEDLSMIIEDVNKTQEFLIKISPICAREDYENARQQINQGESCHSNKDIANT